MDVLPAKADSLTGQQETVKDSPAETTVIYGDCIHVQDCALRGVT